MTGRERLIELLAKASGKYMFVDKYNEVVADYLLENGVIVQPCKVGDTVYVNPYTLGYLSFTDYEHCFIHSTHFVVAEVVSIIKTRKQNLIKLKIYNRTACKYEYKRYPISSIGITVLLTREEAEKASEAENEKQN